MQGRWGTAEKFTQGGRYVAWVGHKAGLPPRAHLPVMEEEKAAAEGQAFMCYCRTEFPGEVPASIGTVPRLGRSRRPLHQLEFMLEEELQGP